MPSYNRITIVGHLGGDPEIRYTPQGTPVSSFTMAVSERKKVDNEWKENPVWFKIKVWGRQAESVSQFLSKGSACLVSGPLTIEIWTNRDGQNMTNLVVNANDVQFLSGGSGERRNTSPADERPRVATAPTTPPANDLTDDDIPF